MADTTTRAHPSAAESITPDARQWWQRNQRWIWGALILLLVGAVTIATYGGLSLTSNRTLDPSSPAPEGAKGLVTSIANHGVEFEHAQSYLELDAAVSTAAGSSLTLVVEDPYYVLEEANWEALLTLGADRVVVLSSSFPSLAVTERVATFEGSFEPRTNAEGDVINEAMPETFEAGTCDGTLDDLAPAITNLGGREFVTVGDATGCYPVRDGYAVIIGEDDGTEIIVLGAQRNLSNEHIVRDANAAMAITLLGTHEQLVWYTPAAGDFADSDGPSFGSYVPQWLMPVLLLIYLAGFMAILWRGRRFGPLVTERLPVTVPANETLEGRARLYDASNSRLRALDSIRVGTLTRLANLSGVGAGASVDEVITATARLARVPRAHAHRVLLSGEPSSDRELVDLANAVAELERRVRAATGRAKSTRTSDHRTDTADTSARGKQVNEHDE